MRESSLRMGLFAAVIIVALGVIVLVNSPKEFFSSRADDGDSGPEATPALTGGEDSISPALAPFSAISLNVPARIAVTVGADQSVTVRGERALLAKISLRSEDGRLVIAPKGHNLRIKNDGVEILIGVPELSELTINGAAKGRLTGFSGGAFALTVNGAADLALEGRCDSLALTVNGAGKIAARPLTCDAVNATINGAGAVDVYARQRISGAIAGAGKITVAGRPPEVAINRMGLGRVQILSDDES